MKQLILLPATFLSALLAVTFAGMWIRSHYVGDGWSFVTANGRERQFISYAGGVHVYETTPTALLLSPAATTRPSRTRLSEPVPPGARWSTRYPTSPGGITWNAAGFAMTTGERTVSGSFGFGSALPPSAIGSPYSARGFSGVDGGYGGMPFYSSGSGSFGAALAPPTSTVNEPPVYHVGVGSRLPLAGTIWVSPHCFAAVVVPYWFLVVVSAVLPCVGLLKLPRLLRQRRRRKLGLCQVCGYDLRASNDRCPECGTPIPDA